MSIDRLSYRSCTKRTTHPQTNTIQSGYDEYDACSQTWRRDEKDGRLSSDFTRAAKCATLSLTTTIAPASSRCVSAVYAATLCLSSSASGKTPSVRSGLTCDSRVPGNRHVDCSLQDAIPDSLQSESVRRPYSGTKRKVSTHNSERCGLRKQASPPRVPRMAKESGTELSASRQTPDEVRIVLETERRHAVLAPVQAFSLDDLYKCSALYVRQEC